MRQIAYHISTRYVQFWNTLPYDCVGCEKKISSVCLLLDTFSCPMMTDGRTCVHKKSRLLSYDWLESRSNSSSHTSLLWLVLCEHCCCWDAVSHILKQWKPKQNCQQWWLLWCWCCCSFLSSLLNAHSAKYANWIVKENALYISGMYYTILLFYSYFSP